MRHPQLKRRRLSSNPLVPLPSLTPNLFVASLKPSRISTCNSCHRTIKSSPPLVCARCSASTCPICMRTCTGPLPRSRGTGTRDPSPQRLPPPSLLSNTSTASPSRRRRPRDEDIDTILTVKDSECEGGGCGRMVCRICCLEILQSETVACLDCFAAPHAPPTHGLDTSMQEAVTDNTFTVPT